MSKQDNEEAKVDILRMELPLPIAKERLEREIAQYTGKDQKKSQMWAMLQLALVELNLGNNKEASSYRVKCEKYTLKYGSKEQKGINLFILGYLLNSRGKFEEALEQTIKASKLLLDSNLDSYLIRCYILCGIICKHLSMYSEGIVYISRAIEQAKQSNDINQQIRAMHNMLEVKLTVLPMEENYKDINLFLEYLHTVYTGKDSIAEVKVLWNLSAILLDLKQPEKAREAYTLASAMRLRLGVDQYDLPFALRLAEIYGAEGNGPAMETQSLLTINMAVKQQSILFEMGVYLMRIRFYLNAKDLGAAEYNLKKVTRLLEKESPSQIAKTLTEYRVDYYKAIGDLEKVIYYLEIGKDYEVEVQQKLAAQRIWHATAVHELEIAERKNEIMQKEVKHNIQELNMASHYLQQRNELLNDLKSKIKSLKNENAQREVIFKTLFDQIDIAFNREDIDRNLFKEKFDQSHAEYINKLNQQYPSLSPSECRICALMYSGFSTKEISNLTHTTERNIESQRLSIRKKMGLTRSQNLQSVLAAIQGKLK